MYTAAQAQAERESRLDNRIRNAVSGAAGTSTYIPVYRDEPGDMNKRADALAAELKRRGFTKVEVRDRDSYRFAEVHFSWEPEN